MADYPVRNGDGDVIVGQAYEGSRSRYDYGPDYPVLNGDDDVIIPWPFFLYGFKRPADGSEEPDQQPDEQEEPTPPPLVPEPVVPEEPIITATTEPVMGTLKALQTPLQAYTPGAFVSRKGVIVTVTPTFEVNGKAALPVTVLRRGDTVRALVLVVDLFNSIRTFVTNTVTVQSRF